MAPVPTEVKYEEPPAQADHPDLSKPDNPDAPNEKQSTADDPKPSGKKQKCVVVGLGMVGIAFIEKLLKNDIDGGRDEWEVVV